MRILHIYRTYFPDPPGGIQQVIRQLCLATQPLGIESQVLTLSPQPEPRRVTLPEATVLRERSWAAPASCDLGDWNAFRHFSAAARQADVVQLHYPWPFGDLLALTLPRAKPLILTYHSDIVRQRWLGKLYAPLLALTLRRAQSVTAATPDYAASSPVLTRPDVKAKLGIIPYAVTDRREEYGPERCAQLRTRFNLSAPYILALGVFRYYKGFHSLVAAAPHIPATVVIAGSGPEEERLRAQTAANGARNIVFAGQVSDDEKFALMQGCEAFVLPSHLRSEAFGMVLVEAAMMGKPLVSCAIGSGMSYINIHNETGFAVPPEAPQELSEAIRTLLEDETLRSRLGSAARQRYEKVFSPAQFGESYAALYRKLVHS